MGEANVKRNLNLLSDEHRSSPLRPIVKLQSSPILESLGSMVIDPLIERNSFKDFTREYSLIYLTMLIMLSGKRNFLRIVFPQGQSNYPIQILKMEQFIHILRMLRINYPIQP